MTVGADGRPVPWDDGQVVTFPERDGWVFWVAGLDGAALADVADSVPGGTNNEAVLSAIRALDEDATSDGTYWGCGVWFPAAHGHEARAGVLLRTERGRGDRRKAYKRFLREARSAPRIEGVTISSYNVDEGEVDLGPFVSQGLDTVGDDGGLQIRWTLTFFPEVKDEVVQMEFQTVHAHLADDIEDEIADLISRAYYAVEPGGRLDPAVGR